MVKFTATEQRILEALADGRLHSREELVRCLPDDMSYSGLYMHMTRIRKKLNPIGEDIVCRTRDGNACYYHARLVPVSG